jgi:Ni2+-binding GTPase involved in maturation of urease and hydrogenase
VLDHERNDEGFKPLRMVVTGTDGSGKSYLIKGLVKAVRTYYNTNKVVQVLCPTGNSANLISGVTIHSFFGRFQ